MSSFRVAYALGVGLTAVGLIITATPTATDARGVQPFRAAPEIPRSGIDSLGVWIDSVRRQHNIPAMGAIVFRADTVLARGIAGVNFRRRP